MFAHAQLQLTLPAVTVISHAPPATNNLVFSLSLTANSSGSRQTNFQSWYIMNGIPKELVASSGQFRFFVGPDAKEYTIHSDLVALQSPVLSALVSGGLSESITQSVKWDDIDEPSFLSFWEFSYTGDYDVSDAAYSKSGSNGLSSSDEDKEATDGQNGSPSSRDGYCHEDEAECEQRGEGHMQGIFSSTARNRQRPAMTWSDHVLGTEYPQDVKDGDYAGAALHHARVYILADRYGITRLMNLSIHKLGTVMKTCTEAEDKTQGIMALLQLCYTNFVPDRLIRLAIHHAADSILHLWELEEFHELLITHAALSKTMLELFLPVAQESSDEGDDRYDGWNDSREVCENRTVYEWAGMDYPSFAPDSTGSSNGWP
ncbi:unnamed protein product [Clonostachys rhizophaga]|uniref:BTB domain-containing protein n=1 Tax=Clonostachys rhizophaga TaxID=160324 RepID=A0A9N9V725_9HYPO|nr:unnamed protein product [Clonostachys rhizophaga]